MNSVEHSKLRLVVRNQIIGMVSANPLFVDSFRALNYAEKVHCGLRKDGSTPEINHQYNIASFFIGLIPMIRYANSKLVNAVSDNIINDCLVSIFLHDTVEDYPDTYEDIANKFPNHIDYITSLSKYHDATGENTDSNYYDNLSKNIITVLVKAIDRLHNLSTIKVLGEVKTQSYCEHTRQFLLPMIKTARMEYFEYVPILEHIKSVITITITALETKNTTIVLI